MPLKSSYTRDEILSEVHKAFCIVHSCTPSALHLSEFEHLFCEGIENYFPRVLEYMKLEGKSSFTQNERKIILLHFQDYADGFLQQIDKLINNQPIHTHINLSQKSP